MIAKMKTLAERLTNSVKAIGRSTLPYILTLTTLLTQTGYAFPNQTNKNNRDTSSVADTLQSGEVYGPETPAGFGDVYGPRTPDTTKVSEQPKQKPSIENMNIDSVDANYRFQLSMNRMEDGDEKRLIIAEYILAPRYATPSQLSEIETIDVSDPKELARLNEIFHEVFLARDPNRRTYENEFITKTILDRVRYAGGIQRKCFHDTGNEDLSVVRPVEAMLDAYGQAIIIDGYIDDTPDQASDIEDVLGSSRDKPKAPQKTFEEEIYVRFKNNPRIWRIFVRDPKTNFIWMEPGNTPQAQRAKSEGAIALVTEDSIPPLSQEDASLYFIPVPNEARTSFRGISYLLINPNPFVVKTDSGKCAEFMVNTFVHRPDSSLVVADPLKRSIPVPNEGFDKNDRIRLTLPTSIPIYNLGDTIKDFQYSVEILTTKKDPEKWSGDEGAGSVFINVAGPTPVHFGYIVNEDGRVQVPAAGQRGDSLTIRFPRQLVSHDKRVYLPKPDSTGNFPLEYIVTATRSSDEIGGRTESGRLVNFEIIDRLIRQTLRTGRIPDTYEADVLVGKKIQERVNGRLREKIDTTIETRMFDVTHDQRSYITDFLAPVKSGGAPIFTDTLFGSANSVTGENEVTIPLPDSVFQEGQKYNFSIEVNPRNHDRFSPDTHNTPQPIAYQLGVVKDVKIVKKIPGKRNKK